MTTLTLPAYLSRSTRLVRMSELGHVHTTRLGVVNTRLLGRINTASEMSAKATSVLPSMNREVA